MQQNIFDQFDKPTSQVIPGTVGAKPTEAQARAMGFYERMSGANKYMNAIEDTGFDPVNIRDIFFKNNPFIPDVLERFAQTTKFKLYNTAKINFSTAQLRRETGAVINDSEIVWIDETYFPQLGEGREVQDYKREQRSGAVNAMKREAESFYDIDSIEEVQEKALGDERRRALKLLKQRLASELYQRPENKELYERTERVAKQLAEMLSQEE